MGSDLVYVSGRKRAPGEMNGKSCNLNNCLKQVYPEGVPIPPTELVCIFDADQVQLAVLIIFSFLLVRGIAQLYADQVQEVCSAISLAVPAYVKSQTFPLLK